MSEKPVTVEFGIIHDWDPEAANDDCYVTSSDSIENRTGLNWSLPESLAIQVASTHRLIWLVLGRDFLPFRTGLSVLAWSDVRQPPQSCH
jgi:hypothetical protein